MQVVSIILNLLCTILFAAAAYLSYKAGGTGAALVWLFCSIAAVVCAIASTLDHRKRRKG